MFHLEQRDAMIKNAQHTATVQTEISVWSNFSKHISSTCSHMKLIDKASHVSFFL